MTDAEGSVFDQILFGIGKIITPIFVYCDYRRMLKIED